MMKTVSFNVRRRFAKTAFACIVATLFFVLGVAAFGDAQTAANLREAGIIIAPIVLCLAGVIAQYAHLVYKTDNPNVPKD